MNEVIVITGQRGKGKSTYIKSEIENFDRVVIFDLLGEFTYYPTSYNIEEFLQNLSKQKREDFFIINYYNPKNSENDFRTICKALNRNQNIMFVVDELDYFATANFIPKEFSEIIKRGRHQNINVMIATRRPHEIPRLVTSQVSQFITFRHVEPRDLIYMRDVCGFDEEEIKNLKDFNFLLWKNGIISKGKVNQESDIRPHINGETERNHSDLWNEFLHGDGEERKKEDEDGEGF